jgi:hypothetical protein
VNNSPKLQATTNYNQFSLARDNRGVNVLNLRPQHKALREDMQRDGFNPACPIMVRQQNGKMVIVDGQHRFTFAREFGLPIYYVAISDLRVSIARLNQTQANWTMADYANRWANDGKADYNHAIEFAREYGIPIGSAFSMLGGTIVFKNIAAKFHAGTFKVKTPEAARRAAECYRTICETKKGLRHNNLLCAVWACCHVDYFDENRIIETSQRRPELLSNCGSRDGFLQMLEEVYNFNRKTRAPLRFDAEEAMRIRNPGTGKSQQAAA